MMSINRISLNNNVQKATKYSSISDIKKKEIVDNFVDSPKMEIIDKIQLALDIIGLEQTVGWVADGTNSLISLFRATLAKEKDQKKRHIINAGISAVSMIPFADLVKLLKLRRFPKIAKAYIKTARGIKNHAKVTKNSGTRFQNNEIQDSNLNQRMVA